MKIFKIKNKKGLFSTGGRYAKWSKKGKIWDSRENAQKAIDWYTRDEKSWHNYAIKDYLKNCEQIKKHNTYPYNVKIGNIWPMPFKPKLTFTPFYKNAKIVKFNIEEIK